MTFDYNYVRVNGAAAKKCVCGSSACRGYIGGDPLNSEVIVQGDSDEEGIEPVMIRKNGLRELTLNDSMFKTDYGKGVNHKETSAEKKSTIGTHLPAIPVPEMCLENTDNICRTKPEVNSSDISLQNQNSTQSENSISRPEYGSQSLDDSEPDLNSIQVKEIVCRPPSNIQTQEISLQASISINELPSDSVLSTRKSIPSHCEQKPKRHFLSKAPLPKDAIKRGRSGVKNLVSRDTKILTASPNHCDGGKSAYLFMPVLWVTQFFVSCSTCSTLLCS